MISRNLLTLLILLSLVSTPAIAQTLKGKVVDVSDGDTITVQDSRNKRHKIRLSGIDAPEKNQPFAQASKESLSELVFWRNVNVTWNKTDGNHRIMGKVKIGKTDASLQQLKRGLAWYCKMYEKDLPQKDRRAYFLAQHEAKLKSAGLWSEPEPTAPWDWQRQQQ